MTLDVKIVGMEGSFSSDELREILANIEEATTSDKCPKGAVESRVFIRNRNESPKNLDYTINYYDKKGELLSSSLCSAAHYR